MAICPDINSTAAPSFTSMVEATTPESMKDGGQALDSPGYSQIGPVQF